MFLVATRFYLLVDAIFPISCVSSTGSPQSGENYHSLADGKERLLANKNPRRPGGHAERHQRGALSWGRLDSTSVE